MAVTYSLINLGLYSAAIRNQLICIAATNSEALTIVHMLGACPTEIRFALRSTVTTSSGLLTLVPNILTHNASQSTVAFGNPNNPLGAAMFDIFAENRHSLVS